MVDNPTSNEADTLPRQPIDAAAYERRSREGPCFICETLADNPDYPGHIVWTDFTPTGDGIAASLLVLRALAGRRLEEVEPFERLPQRLENVRVADREAINGAEVLWSAVEEENAKLDGRGRVLVRPSGTEPLLRVMVEAPDPEECEAVTDRLVEIAKRELA